MNCPRDDKPLEHLTKKGIEFEGCRECKGLLVERESVQRLLKRAEPHKIEERAGDDYFKRLLPASEFLKSNTALTCPKCKYNMYETENRGIRLDFCLNCQSIWFDAGELQQIVQRLNAGESVNLVPLPAQEVDHTSGLILHLLRDEWL